MLPIWISGAGIVASFLGFFAVGCKDGAGQKELMWALHKGVLVSSFLVVGFSALIVAFLFEGRETEGWELFGCICIGLVAGVLSTYFLYFHESIFHNSFSSPILLVLWQQLGKSLNISHRMLTGLLSLSPRPVSRDLRLLSFRVSVLACSLLSFLS